jgi:hypothetical protein
VLPPGGAKVSLLLLLVVPFAFWHDRLTGQRFALAGTAFRLDNQQRTIDSLTKGCRRVFA